MVLTFLVAAYFSYVSGDTVRAGYLLAVGLALSWDQAHRRGPRRSPAGGRAGPRAGQADPAVPAQIAFSGESADHRRAVMQPSLHTDSYAHPTLSVLADPVLASVPGRSAVLFAWLAFSWYLARR